MELFVNGQRYQSWNDIPAEIREGLLTKLPDADRNGVPDVLEGKGDLSAAMSSWVEPVVTTSEITVNGHTVDAMSELPPQVLDALRQAGLGGLTDHPAPAVAPDTPTPQPSAAQPLAPHQLNINGRIVDVNAPSERPRRWWQFWK